MGEGGEAAGTGCLQPGCSSDSKQVWPGEFPISAAAAAALAGYSCLLFCLLREEDGRRTPKTSVGNRSLCFLAWGSSVVWVLDQLMQ